MILDFPIFLNINLTAAAKTSQKSEKLIRKSDGKKVKTEIRIEDRIRILFVFCFSLIFWMPKKLIFIQPFNILVITEN